MSWIFLSYILEEETPAYGGGTDFRSEAIKQILEGDSCNTQFWRFSNHIGTHIDAPRHFTKFGTTVDELSPSFWIFENPHFIDLGSVPPTQIVGAKQLIEYSIPKYTDILLLKTGFCFKRSTTDYIAKNPGIEPALAGYLRSILPDIRVIGFDIISLSSYASRDTGREAHRSFLDNPHPILILEDMDLHALGPGIELLRIVVAPMRVRHADGSPCTVFAEIKS